VMAPMVTDSHSSVIEDLVMRLNNKAFIDDLSKIVDMICYFAFIIIMMTVNGRMMDYERIWL
jgi:hypothetical protein